MHNLIKGESTKHTLNGQCFVTLLDWMGTDKSVVEAARTSYDRRTTKEVRPDEVLIDYLIRNEHLSCVEMVSIKFLVTAPISMTRQIQRHRTAKMNEASARYSPVSFEFFTPEVLRDQNSTNKQSSGDPLPDEKQCEAYLIFQNLYKQCYKDYEHLLKIGVCREQARMVLPEGRITRFVWKMDLRNLLHFCRLRLEEGAQVETREIAMAMFEFASELFPITTASFKKHFIDKKEEKKSGQ